MIYYIDSWREKLTGWSQSDPYTISKVLPSSLIFVNLPHHHDLTIMSYHKGIFGLTGWLSGERISLRSPDRADLHCRTPPQPLWPFVCLSSSPKSVSGSGGRDSSRSIGLSVYLILCVCLNCYTWLLLLLAQFFSIEGKVFNLNGIRALVYTELELCVLDE